VNLNITAVRDLTAGRLAVNFENKSGKLRNGSISMGGETFSVSFAGQSATVKKQFAGFFGGLKSFFWGRTAEAQAIERKMNDIIRENGGRTFQIVSNSRAYLGHLMEKAPGEGRLEVADYGLSRNRNAVRDAKLVEALNEKFGAATGRKLFFNQIDTYNSLFSIEPASFTPMHFAETLEQIKTGTLPQNKYVSTADFDMETANAWKAFLARPGNVEKIDIPGKLHRLLNLPQGHVPAKQTGWEATFANARNKDEALAKFVLKNIPKSAKDITPKEFEVLCSRVKRFAELSAMPEGEDKARQMKEFFKRENWLGRAEEDKLDELRNDESYKDCTEEEIQGLFEYSTPTERCQRYVTFSNVFTNAMFRQTSKMGLEFFKEQGIPVLFQYADHTGKSMEGRFVAEVKNEAARHGLDDIRKSGGSPITYSEMRRAAKISKEASLREDDRLANTPIVFTPGAKT
jgi:hypothetical protein